MMCGTQLFWYYLVSGHPWKLEKVSVSRAVDLRELWAPKKNWVDIWEDANGKKEESRAWQSGYSTDTHANVRLDSCWSQTNWTSSFPLDDRDFTKLIPLFCCPVKGHIRVRYHMDTLFADVLHAWVDVQIMETENITNRPFHISAACCNLNNFLIISDIYGEIVRPGQAFACQIQKFTEYLSGNRPYLILTPKLRSTQAAI